MDEVVKYSNHLNRLSFKDFSDYDLNFLMAVCAKIKDLGEEIQHFDYDKLMELLDWDITKSIDIFHKDLKRMSERLRHVGATIEINPDTFTAFNLFSEFEGDKKKRTLTVRVNPRFKYILNDLTTNFTRFELSEYVHLDGKYSKLLYQHLKQFRRTGWWQASVNDIRRELAIPDSMPTRNIVTKVLNPSIDIIKTCKGFEGLNVEVIRSHRRGCKVEGYKFTWTAENQIPGQMTFDEYAAINKATKKAQFRAEEERKYNFDELERDALNW